MDQELGPGSRENPGRRFYLRDLSGMKLKFGLRLLVWVHYPNGKKKKVIDRVSRSYVRAFIDTISGQFRDSAHTFKRTSGADAASYLNSQINAAAGDITHGIVIGTGFSDVVIDDYALNSIIANGGSVGQMLYGKQHWTTPDASLSNKRFWEAHRYISNQYSLPQVVRECGLYVKNGGTTVYYCFVRDLLGRVEVPPRGGISINYKFEITI
jgi:hypothetical protein